MPMSTPLPLPRVLRPLLLALPLVACGNNSGHAPAAAGGGVATPTLAPAAAEDFAGCWSMDKAGAMVLFRLDHHDGAYQLFGRNGRGEFKPATEPVAEPSPEILKASLPREVDPGIVDRAVVSTVHQHGLDAFGLYKIKRGMSTPGKAPDSDYVAMNTGPVYRVPCPKG